MLCELGFIASRQTKAHEGETTGAITVGGSDAAGRGVPDLGLHGHDHWPSELDRRQT
jgi:hypothetical protein